jgi:ABC-type phosphate transport system substrate-binding protein
MTGSCRLARAVVALAILCCSLPDVVFADVKVHGATTVTFGLMRPRQAEIEKLARVQLTILPSSTSHGLTDLVQGKADIAMLAEPLEDIAAVMNRKKPGFVNLAEYTGRHVANAYVQIIVHPSNPVKALSNDQLAGLFSGRIRSWSEVGGANQPVLTVGEPTSSPYRMIQDALKIAYAPDLRVVQNANQTAIIVAQAPGAISYITTAHDLPIRSKLKVVGTDLKLPLQLHLAIRKDAPEHVKRVVEAAASLGEK